MAKTRKKTALKKTTKKSKSKKTLPRAPRSPKDLPATYGALQSVRLELKSDITSVKVSVCSLESKMDSKFTVMQNDFQALESKMDSKFTVMQNDFQDLETKMDSKFTVMQNDFRALESTMKNQFEETKAISHRMLALLEEQNSRNKASYEGAESVRAQQDKLAERVDKLEEFQHGLTKKLQTN